MIRVENITKLYGDTVAVQDLNFQVERGEILGFLGPNGAGKTTTMQIICGYIPPTHGRVEVFGYDCLEEPLKVKEHIGYLPEHPPLYTNMTVRSYLNFVAEIKGVARSNRASELRRVTERLSLEPVIDRLIANISKGFKQRTGLAQALIGDPEILILDEPTVGLDPKQIIEIRELVRELGKEHTVILSSHILPEVSMVTERVVIINEGRIEAIDTTEKLSERLNRGSMLRLTIDGPRNEIPEVLEAVKGIRNFQFVNEDESKDQSQEGVSFDIETESDIDVRRDLFFTMAERKWPVIEMRRIDLSLEEIFLELTTEEEEVA